MNATDRYEHKSAARNYQFILRTSRDPFEFRELARAVPDEHISAAGQVVADQIKAVADSYLRPE